MIRLRTPVQSAELVKRSWLVSSRPWPRPLCAVASASAGGTWSAPGCAEKRDQRHRHDRGDGAQIEHVDIADHQRLARDLALEGEQRGRLEELPAAWQRPGAEDLVVRRD